MAVISLVDIGAAPNDGNGDPLRTAYTKTNTNDTNLNAEVEAATTAIAGLGGLSTGNDAGDVPFTPTGTIAANDVQTAVAEVSTDAAADTAAAVAGAPLISTEDELAGQMEIAVVATLPGSPDANTIYFVTT